MVGLKLQLIIYTSETKGMARFGSFGFAEASVLCDGAKPKVPNVG
jgi:hypothetical protein